MPKELRPPDHRKQYGPTSRPAPTRKAGRRPCFPRHHGRAPTRRARPAQYRAPSHRGAAAARQDPRQLRIRTPWPMISKGKVMLVAAGDARLEAGADLMLFGRSLQEAPAQPGCVELQPEGRPAAARAISRRRSAWPSSKSGWERPCSPRPPTSCKSSRWRGADSHSRRPSNRLDRFHLLILVDLALCHRRTRPRPTC